MQNPFRQNRPQDDFGQRDPRDDQRWEARDHRCDERSSWSEGDGGRTAEAYRHQGHSGQYGHDREMSGARGMGYGQPQQSQYGGGLSTGWTGDRQPQPGSAYDPYGYGAQALGPSQYQQPHYGGQQARGDAGAWSGPSSSGGQGHAGYSQGGAYGGSAMTRGAYSGPQSQGGSMNQGSWGAASHGYAPGAQIWEGSGPGMGGQSHEHHDFEPDYLHWRQQQLSAFDSDYSTWRNERREKFSSDFDSWRQSRPRSVAQHTPAENPIVGDVSDGGVGNAAEAKKRQ